MVVGMREWVWKGASDEGSQRRLRRRAIALDAVCRGEVQEWLACKVGSEAWRRRRCRACSAR